MSRRSDRDAARAAEGDPLLPFRVKLRLYLEAWKAAGAPTGKRRKSLDPAALRRLERYSRPASD